MQMRGVAQALANAIAHDKEDFLRHSRGSARIQSITAAADAWDLLVSIYIVLYFVVVQKKKCRKLKLFGGDLFVTVEIAVVI